MMTPPQHVSEVDVALDSMADDVGRLVREKAVGAAKLATAQQRIRQLQAELEERDATIALLQSAPQGGVEVVFPDDQPAAPEPSQPEQET